MGRPIKTATGPMINANEAESIKDDLNKLKEMAGAGEMGDKEYSPTSQIDDICIDKTAIRRKIEILSRQLDAHKAQKVTDSVKRNKLLERRKWLEDKFKDCLETYRDLGVVRRDSPDWSAAFRKATERPQYEAYITEWKRIGLMLDPEDRNINSFSRLRKDC